MTFSETFCGKEEWWNTNLTWRTEYPRYTQCFEWTILTYMPAFMLCIAAGTAVQHQDYRATLVTERTPLTVLNLTRAVIICLLGLSYLISIVWSAFKGFEKIPLASIMADAVNLVSCCIIVMVEYMSRVAGRCTSIVLWSYWLFVVMVTLPRYYRVMLVAFNPNVHALISDHSFIMIAVTYPFAVTMFVLNSFADRKPLSEEEEKLNPSPVLRAPPFSILIFEWLTPIIVKGYKRTLNLSDVYDALPQLKSRPNYLEWQERWDKELNRAKYHPETGTYDMKRPPSLLKTFLATFWPVMLIGYSVSFLRSFIRVSPALLLSMVTRFMMNSSEPLWRGILYAFVIFFAATINSLCFRHVDYTFSKIGLKVKSVLMSAIYAKLLRMSSKSQSKYTVGELVNMVSVDADKVLRVCTTSANMIASPTTIILSVVLLWQYLGPACFAGVGVMFLVMPVVGTLAYLGKQLQEKQMTLKDQRLKNMNEMITSIKILKLFAWEPPFTDRVNEIRAKEVSILKKLAYVVAGVGFFFTCTPFFVGLVSFLTFVMLSKDNILTPTTAFVSLTLFSLMRTSMIAIPDFITSAVQAAVSWKRIYIFLLCEEMNPGIIGSKPSKGNAISMTKVKACWNAVDMKPVLSNIDLTAAKGKLVAIVGSVGSGKSSLLSAMLGDLVITNGSIDISGSIAYVPQQAWILNQTVRQNIIFTSEFDDEMYNKVINACCLATDLLILEGGDRTEIGEKGINLSGGQKQRIALARAAYQDRDIYLFDDPLSAVDAHVGKAIFTDLIGPKGMLSTKTRILVTNNLSVLSEVDYIIVLKHGRIIEEGTYANLMAENAQDLLKDIIERKDVTMPDRQMLRTGKAPGTVKAMIRKTKILAGSFTAVNKASSTMKTLIKKSKALGGGGVAAVTRKLTTKFKIIAKEVIEEGSIKLQVYLNYVKYVGCGLTMFTLLFYVAYRALDIADGIWLSEWSVDNDTSIENRNRRLSGYAGIGVAQSVCNFIGVSLLTTSTLVASTRLHRLMLESVMRAPLSFFDTTPIGRLLNRFGKDLDQLDVQLSMMANLTLEMFLQIIGMVILISMNIPAFLGLALPVLGVFIVIRQVYIKTFRQVKRLEAVTRSPMFSQFSESVSGLSSIRAYGVSEIFHENMDTKIDVTQNCTFHITVFNYWLSLRLEFLGNLMIFVMVIMLVTNRHRFTAGTAGLLIAYSLNSALAFNYFVSFSSEVEATLISAERIHEYTKVTPEAAWTSSRCPPSQWPKQGRIEFINYSAKYRPDLDFAVRNLNLSITALQKVGVVGRTGAGKSSLILTIFRIIEGSQGKITIDDIDISTIGLHELRSRLTIIPQESMLFNSSIRFNLDPNDEYTDEQLWTALDRAHLKKYFAGKAGLNTMITEGGGNLSAGQRQLVCLARAVLRKTRVLVLDEATAAVDFETDSLIQETIRKVFFDSTIITIAHRLHTILDSDVVLVMDTGRIVEMNQPKVLLQDPRSRFSALAREAGIGTD